MRTAFLIAAAGLTALVAAARPVRAQFYGWWGYYRPYYYPVPYPYYPPPYPYYPGPYYAPPPVYESPPPVYTRRAAIRLRRVAVPRRHRVVHRTLVNPLLGPLPGSPR